MDITNQESFNQIKKLHQLVDIKQYPNLSIILVSNKLDLEEARTVTGLDITNFVDTYKYIKQIEISLKMGSNFPQLEEEIYSALNDNKKKVAINLVSEYVSTDKLVHHDGVLKVVLLGDSQVGKSAFLGRKINFISFKMKYKIIIIKVILFPIFVF